MFEVINKGLFFTTNLGNFGNQDVGISPCGAMDKFSYLTGNILLNNSENSLAFEIIFPPTLKAQKGGVFIFTGAPCRNTYIKRKNNRILITHNQVYGIEVDDLLYIGEKEEGFRTYLCFRELINSLEIKQLQIRKRGNLKESVHWYPKDGCIRVVKGPEFKYLKNPNDFFNNYWFISRDTNNMGMKLESEKVLEVSLKNMISEAVADGTIQLTPNGPIVLLRHRQTIGGYPRCFNVINSDLDLLAQYIPGQIIRFRLVTMEEAFLTTKIMINDLDRLRERYKI